MVKHLKIESSREKFQALPAKSPAYNLGDQVDIPETLSD